METGISTGQVVDLIRFSSIRTIVRFLATETGGAPERGIYTARDTDLGDLLHHHIDHFAYAGVWVDDFVDLSFDFIQDGLESYFEENRQIREIDIIFYFMNGRDIDGITVEFHRNRTLKMHFSLHGGIPYPTDEARMIAEAAFTRLGTSLDEISYSYDEDEDGDYASGWCLTFTINDSTSTIGQHMECWKSARSGLCTYCGDTGPDHRVDVIHKILEGKFAEILGEVESSSLEFKSNLELNTRRGKETLIKVVSAFANSDRSAALVLGFGTRRINNHDTVVSVTPVLKSEHSADRYRQIIDSYIRPPIRGLGINVVAAGQEG
jgi:hypothetical protein